MIVIMILKHFYSVSLRRIRRLVKAKNVAERVDKLKEFKTWRKETKKRNKKKIGPKSE